MSCKWTNLIWTKLAEENNVTKGDNEVYGFISYVIVFGYCKYIVKLVVGIYDTPNHSKAKDNKGREQNGVDMGNVLSYLDKSIFGIKLHVAASNFIFKWYMLISFAYYYAMRI